MEVGWEVCQQLGGIYTVLRSKAPSFVKALGDSYCLIGPYNPETAPFEFEESAGDNVFAKACQKLKLSGLDARTGRWLIPGRPRVVLLNLSSIAPQLSEIKYFLWQNHQIQAGKDDLVDQVLLFGAITRKFLDALIEEAGSTRIVAHFHEWMAGTALPGIRRDSVPLATTFTTHATLLGRYLAQADHRYFERLPFVDVDSEIRRFNIEVRSRLEMACAHGAHVFTTLSDITKEECTYLLKRKPDILTPNGIHVERPVALHEFQNLHVAFKERIDRFVIGHFFPTYTFDLDKTLYFFSAGRYEYRNKGFDLLLDALARLNRRLRESGSEKTVVAFIITKRPYHTINPAVFANFAMTDELRRVCEEIQQRIGDRLFHETALGNRPALESLVEEYWWIRLRRTTHAWKKNTLPPVITHNLVDDAHDDVLNQIRYLSMFNAQSDRVKVIYHPDFLSETNPLFGMDYEQFSRGCHLGIFPGSYEPWGYTPLECLVRGVPAVTSDLAGFGSYVKQNIPSHQNSGLYVLARRGVEFQNASTELTAILENYCRLERRDRIVLRNRCEALSDRFDWMDLASAYFEAHGMALSRTK
ncbi:MAG: hypothetical protein K1X70_20470 [Leptospirales bacterium]|nr:hypothetical protein [Leptospirales bacterium]